ncbi:MAG TPA: hypothetical protein VG755_33380 [Nannocystaceae bacterium]|nr:hypothetical protein [Nannocystaceae bacterium]
MLLSTGCPYSPGSAVTLTGMQTESSGSEGSTTMPTTGPVDSSSDATATSASTMTSNSSSTASTSDTGADDTTTTSGPDCEVDDDCNGAELCVDGECMWCTDAPDPDAACADASADAPYCDPTNGCAACVPSACSEDTPACDPMVGCVACTEHAQCPDSACHLMGPDVGRCFDIADVVEISALAEFETEIANVGAGVQRVFRITDSLPDMGSYFVGGELAILGGPGIVLSGGYTNLFAMSEGSLLYIASVDITDGPNRAIRNDGDGLWLDDVTLADYPVGILATVGETHLRRSRISASGAGSIAFDSAFSDGAAALIAENSVVGPGAESGLAVGGAVDLRYVTIVGNDTSISCELSASGTVRNSIVAGATDASISGCSYLSWIDDAVDTASLGDQIGAYDGDWFVNAPAADFHLSAAGQAAIGDIADWDDGDPLVDIDGDARPMDMDGYPGVDEP